MYTQEAKGSYPIKKIIILPVSKFNSVFRPSTYWLKGRQDSQQKGHCNTTASICGNDGVLTKNDLWPFIQVNDGRDTDGK